MLRLLLCTSPSSPPVKTHHTTLLLLPLLADRFWIDRHFDISLAYSQVYRVCRPTVVGSARSCAIQCSNPRPSSTRASRQTDLLEPVFRKRSWRESTMLHGAKLIGDPTPGTPYKVSRTNSLARRNRPQVVVSHHTTTHTHQYHPIPCPAPHLADPRSIPLKLPVTPPNTYSSSPPLQTARSSTLLRGAFNIPPGAKATSKVSNHPVIIPSPRQSSSFLLPSSFSH